MKRKVIQIANSTQLVSLPRKWAQHYNIKKGDELEITETGNKLSVSVDKEPQLERAKIQYTTQDKFIRRPLRLLYKLGYDEVDVQFDDPSVLESIQLDMNNLLGFEVVHQGNKSCTIKSVATASDSEFEPILRRVFLMLVSMAKDSYQLMAEKKYDQLTNILPLEKTNNKLTLFCLRLLGKSGYKEFKKTPLIYSMVSQLEYLADDFRDVCKHVIEQKPKLNKKALSCYKMVSEQLEAFYKLFYKQDMDIKDLYAFKQKTLEIKKEAKSLVLYSKELALFAHFMLKINDELYHALEHLH